MALIFPEASYCLVVRLLRVLRIFKVFKMVRYLSEANILLRTIYIVKPQTVVEQRISRLRPCWRVIPIIAILTGILTAEISSEMKKEAFVAAVIVIVADITMMQATVITVA